MSKIETYEALEEEEASSSEPEAPPQPPLAAERAESPGPPVDDAPGFQPRHPKALTLSLIIGGIVTAIVASFLSLVSLLVMLFAGFDSPQAAAALTLSALVILVIAFFLLVMPRWRHQRYRYRADERGLEIHRGVWWRIRIRVPRSRLQHTDIAQGPLQRRLGLASLVVHTAGTHDSSTTLSGLSLERILEVRELLTGEEQDVDGV